MKLPLILAAALLPAHALLAATYFVDYSSGNDSNPGTSSSQPWRHCPGDSNATGTAGATTLQPGDSVRFRGGGVYVGTISGPKSGVTYDGTSWGDGRRAGHTTAYAPNTSAWHTKSAESGWLIHGLDIHQVGGYHPDDPVFAGPPGSITEGNTGNGIYLDAPQYGGTVSNCVFRELGHNANVPQNAGGDVIQGNGVALRQGGTNCLVISNFFTRVSVAINLSATTSKSAVGNVIWGNLIATNIRWGVDFSMLSEEARFIRNRIVGNRIGNYSEFDQVNWEGQGDSPHTDGIIWRSNGLLYGTWLDNTIDGNLFWSDSPLNGGGTAAIFLTQGPSGDIANNIFLAVKQPYVVSVSHFNTLLAPQRVRILNNVVFQGSVRNGTETDPAKRQLIIEGNIFHRTDTYRAVTIEGDYRIAGSLNDNLYWNPGLAQSSWVAVYLYGRDTSCTLDDLRAMGYEANGVWGDPLFTDLSVPYLEADLRPRAGSPAINAGLSFTNQAFTDYDRRSRVGMPLTIGALLAEGSTPAPVPPVNLKLVWQANPSEQNLTGYKLYSKTNNAGPTNVSFVLGATNTSHTVQLPAQAAASFVLAAYRGPEEGPPTAPLHYTPEVPITAVEGFEIAEAGVTLSRNIVEDRDAEERRFRDRSSRFLRLDIGPAGIPPIP